MQVVTDAGKRPRPRFLATEPPQEAGKLDLRWGIDVASSGELDQLDAQLRHREIFEFGVQLALALASLLPRPLPQDLLEAGVAEFRCRGLADDLADDDLELVERHITL